MQSSVFTNTMSRSHLNVTEICLLPASRVVSSLACSSTLKVEAICSPVTLVRYQQTTQCYTPKDRILHDHR
jgi:hypothetical protein